MDKEVEIRKFQALLQRSAVNGEDLGRELHLQQKVLISLGLGSKISNLIHDRHARAGIAVEPSHRKVVAPFPVEPKKVTREERAHNYQKRKIKFKLGPAPELFVPYALNANDILIHVEKAIKDEEYRCPACKADLILRAGEVNKKHFAHRGGTDCNGETVLHETAKRLIAQVVIEHADPVRAAAISLDCSCGICKQGFQRLLPKNSFTNAFIEKSIGVFVCDVVALRGAAQVLAIEVCVTNAVNERKSEELAIPWIEVDATSILENPYHWHPTQSRLKMVFCQDCKAAISKLRSVAEKWKLPLSQYAGYRDSSKSDYLAAIEPCWRCSEDTIWYWWAGVPFCEIEPPKPIPRTVKFKFSKAFGGKYWVNCCANCGSLQGDNFVFLADESPFRELPMGELPQAEVRAKLQSASAVKAFMKVIDRNFSK